MDQIKNGYGTLVIRDEDVEIRYSNTKKNIHFKYTDIDNMNSYLSRSSSRSGQSDSYSETCITLLNGEKYIFNEAEEDNYLEIRAAINEKIMELRND